jgi:hypothetical protein
MENKYKITIPEPCQEDWNKMSPNENGRFCSSCAKNVVDFTTMLPDEIQHYFATNKDNRICGKFRKSQLDTVTIQIPSRVLYSQTQYHKIFLLALFISMGTTLFSCADKEGNKQKIDKVEIIKNTTEIKNMTVGMLLPPKSNDSLHQVVPPPWPKNNQVKFVKNNISKIKVNNFITERDTVSIKAQEEEIIYMGEAIYKDPEFKGGIEKFKDYIQQNYVFPKKANEMNREIQASFVTGKDGRLGDIKLIKDVGDGMGQELIRILEKSENWTPGSQNGKMVRNLFSITLFIKTDSVKKSFFKNKFNQRIDSIIVKQ